MIINVVNSSLVDSIKCWFLFCLIFVLRLPGTCQKKEIKIVSGYVQYYFDDNIFSRQKAIDIATEEAKTKALENAYGSPTWVATITRLESVSDQKTIDTFKEYGESWVGGTWLEDLDIKHDFIPNQYGGEDIRVEVKGKATNIDNRLDGLLAKTLGKDIVGYDKFKFESYDYLYFHFKSPINGFLSIYLDEINNTTTRLLPYHGISEAGYKIEADKDYILFSKSHEYNYSNDKIKKYQVVTSNPEGEVNIIYCVFSTDDMSKPVLEELRGPNTYVNVLSSESFKKWIMKKRFDNNTFIELVPIKIASK